MSSQHTFNWGITEDLEAQVRYEPNACKSYVIDISLGCPHKCIYCLFSPLEKMMYKLKNPAYNGSIIPFKLDKFLSIENFPPTVYMCYASDPLGNKVLVKNTITILKKLMEHSVHVLFITKGKVTDELLEQVSQKPHLMHFQVGITNCDDKRNRIIEPGAPSYAARIENLRKLSLINGLGSLSVRIDPLLPIIDDQVPNIERILNDASGFGVDKAVIGYLIVTKDIREKLRCNKFTKESAYKLSERTITISKQELYSIPFEEKCKNLNKFYALCNSKKIAMSVCGCKDEKLKTTDLEWICHPFNRSKREELFKQNGDANVYEAELAHLR